MIEVLFKWQRICTGGLYLQFFVAIFSLFPMLNNAGRTSLIVTKPKKRYHISVSNYGRRQFLPSIYVTYTVRKS